MLSKGDLVRYFYLWSRQAAGGEESGRKARPVCVAIIDAKAKRMFLFPVTTQEPDEGRAALPIQEIECRRRGLAFPSWIICDECNAVDLSQLYDFDSLTPVGRFSAGFLGAVTAKIREVVTERRLKLVRRT